MSKTYGNKIVVNTKFGRDFFNFSWTKRKMNKHISVIAPPIFSSIFELRIIVFSITKTQPKRVHMLKPKINQNTIKQKKIIFGHGSEKNKATRDNFLRHFRFVDSKSSNLKQRETQSSDLLQRETKS